jgi:hypothetical protein
LGGYLLPSMREWLEFAGSVIDKCLDSLRQEHNRGVDAALRQIEAEIDSVRGRSCGCSSRCRIIG